MVRALMRLTGTLGMLVLLLVLAAPVAANGTHITVQLAYLPGVSNHTPARGGSGEANLILFEGDADVSVRGLPVLDGERYEAFLINTDTGAVASIGKFDVGPDGSGAVTGIVETLEPERYNLVAITIESSPDPSPAPSERIALAGRFQSPPPTPDSGTGVATVTPTGPSVPTNGGRAPVTLPSTGFPANAAVGLAVALAVGAIGGGISLWRRR